MQHLERHQTDLVITDLRMPGVSGFAILEWIHASRPDLAGRTVVITGDSGSAELDRNLMGFQVPVLHKPFRIERLLTTCHGLLSRRAGGVHPDGAGGERVLPTAG